MPILPMKSVNFGPLEWSEEILEQIFRHTPVGVALYDLHGTILQANDALCAIAGYARDQVIGRPAASFFHHDDAPGADILLSRFRDAGAGSRRVVRRLVSRSGKVVPVEITVSVIRSPTDEPVCGLAFVEDIGERLDMEKALEESAALYRQVVSDQTEMIVRWKPDGTRTFVNEAYARYFGFSESDLIGTSFFPLVRDDRARIEARIRSLTPDAPSATDIHRVTAAQGSVRWTEWTDRATFDASGQIAMIQSTGRDVTDRVQANEALRLSEARFRGLFEELPVAAWEVDWVGAVNSIRSLGIRSVGEAVTYFSATPNALHDVMGRLRLYQVNERAMALAGVATERAFAEWLLSRSIDQVDPRLLLHGVAPILFDGADSAQAELSLRNAAGENRDVVFHWTRIRQADSAWRILTIVLDVTPQKKSEHEIRRQKERLERAETIAQVGNWEADLLTGLVTSSPEHWRIHNGTIDGPLIRPVSDALERVHPDDRSMLESALRFVADAAPGTAPDLQTDWEFRVVRRDGTIRWLKSKIYLRARDGAPPLLFGVDQDVTEARTAVDALRRSDEMYGHLFTNLPVAVWQTDWTDALAGLRQLGITSPEQLTAALGRDGERVAQIVARRRIIHANQNALDLFGVATPGELMRATWPPKVAPEQLPQFLLTLARVAFGELKRHAFELHIERPDRTEVDVDALLSCSDAAPGHVVSTAIDVTEAKAARDEVRRIAQRYKHLFHVLPVAVWETDWSEVLDELRQRGIDTLDEVLALCERNAEDVRSILGRRKVVDANQHTLDLFGVSDVRGFQQLGWPPNISDVGAVIRTVLPVVFGRVPVARVELAAFQTDGSPIDLDTTVSRNESAPGRIISTGVDISDRKKIERDLLHSQFLLERAQALAHLGSWEISIDRDEIFGSREYWNIMDGKDDGPASRKLSEVLRHVHEDDRELVWQTLVDTRRAFVEGRPLREVPSEFRIVRHDGTIRSVRGQGVYSRTPDGDVRAYGTMQDITEIQKNEEAVRRHREELMRADRMISLGVLVSGVAHEINNPNQFIMLNAPFLANAWTDIAPAVDHFAREHPDFRISGMRWPEVKREIPEIIGEIDRGAERIRSIVSELRAFGRESEPAELRPCSLNEVIRGSLRLLSNHIRRSTANFSVVLADDLPAVAGNAQRLEQVVVNLVMNSCQALTRPDAAVTVTTAFDDAAGRVVMTVADEGRGITAENLKKIRDPFFTTKRAEGGMGLGLAVCDRVVQEHNGTLSFESEPGKGTTARLSLPAMTLQEH